MRSDDSGPGDGGTRGEVCRRTRCRPSEDGPQQRRRALRSEATAQLTGGKTASADRESAPGGTLGTVDRPNASRAPLPQGPCGMRGERATRQLPETSARSVTPGPLARDPKEVETPAATRGWPAVLTIDSPDLLQNSDGGVEFDIGAREDAARADSRTAQTLARARARGERSPGVA